MVDLSKKATCHLICSKNEPFSQILKQFTFFINTSNPINTSSFNICEKQLKTWLCSMCRLWFHLLVQKQHWKVVANMDMKRFAFQKRLLILPPPEDIEDWAINKLKLICFIKVNLIGTLHYKTHTLFFFTSPRNLIQVRPPGAQLGPGSKLVD